MAKNRFNPSGETRLRVHMWDAASGGYYGTDEVDYILSEARREVDAREARREAKHQLAMLAGL